MNQHARNLNAAVVLVGLMVAFGCAKQEKTPASGRNGSVSNEVDIPPELTPKERALQARRALVGRLSTELVRAMSNGGPSAAIKVCSVKAAKIADQVGREHGLSIGRTSFQLRNPKNQPPAWAAHFVEQRVKEPQFVELEGQRTGAFLPIHLNAQCLACHGPLDQLADDVQRQLAQRYPHDQATGFQDGDLRGWFWVEVPHVRADIQ